MAVSRTRNTTEARYVWMPNQAMAMTARIKAGICAPWMPKLMRLMTGNGTPVFWPM
ncbi:hypothetical protein D3C76_1820400 [compost metagenome]